jgi:hypothetical protein
VTLSILHGIYFLGLKNAIFGDLFFQKLSSSESEIAELKFYAKMLELQLNTMKKRYKEVVNKKELVNMLLKVEFASLFEEQRRVFARLGRIYEILKEL